MKPVTFTCHERFQSPAAAIAALMLDVKNWSSFRGYGVLPGIRSAEFETASPEVVGSRILVENTDGSRHVETITEWQPERRVCLRMSEFSPPLSRLADRIEETWDFAVVGDGTQVSRTLAMYPRSVVAKPIVWGLSRLLRRAIALHLRQMREAEQKVA